MRGLRVRCEAALFKYLASAGHFTNAMVHGGRVPPFPFAVRALIKLGHRNKNKRVAGHDRKPLVAVY